MNGCESRNCGFWNGNQCTDGEEFVNGYGEPVCRFHTFAHRVSKPDVLLEAMKEIADWPRNSQCVEGSMSRDGWEGLANVRRFARAAIYKATGK
jgi:hypothetical protein